jgi:hypothetical protein
MNTVNRLLKVVLCQLTFIASFQFVQAQSAFVRAGDLYALESNDTLITPYIFTEVSTFHEGIAWVNKGELYGYIDSLGNNITDFIYADVSAFENGFARVSKDTSDQKFGYINNNGNPTCDLKYSNVKAFRKGLAAVQNDSVWGLIDTVGFEIIPTDYDYPPIVINSSFIIVSKSAKWGIIDQDENVIYPFVYSLITSDGSAFIENVKYQLGLK